MSTLLGTGINLMITLIVAFSPQADGYENLFILPLAFSVIFLLFHRVFSNPLYRVGMAVFNGVEMVRFLFTPLLMSLTGYVGSEGINNGTVAARQQAIWLMVYEVAITYLVLFLATRRYHFDRIRPRNPDPELMFRQGNDNVLIFFLFVTSMLIVAILPGSLTQFTFLVWDFNVTEVSGVFAGALLIFTMKTVLTMAILQNLYRLYKINPRLRYIYASILMSVISTGLVTTDVRMTALNTLISCTIVLYVFYRDRFNLMGSLLGGTLLFIGVYVTIFAMTVKSKGYEQASSNIAFLGTNLEEIMKSLQAYFGGVTNVAISIDMNETFNVFDKTASATADIGRYLFPWNLVSRRFIDFQDTFRISYLYNYQAKGYYGSNAMICPMVGQGLFYFGKLLSPVFSILFAGVLVFVERLRFQVRYYRYYFLLTFMSVAVGMMHMYSFSINLRTVTNILIPAGLFLAVVRGFEWLWREREGRLSRWDLKK